MKQLQDDVLDLSEKVTGVEATLAGLAYRMDDMDAALDEITSLLLELVARTA